jgi:hypothetical protein
MSAFHQPGNTFNSRQRQSEVKHIELEKLGVFCGNHIFASLRSMQCYSKFVIRNQPLGVSRQDDMESYFYLLMFLLHGELPWLSATALVNRQERINFIDTRRMKNNSIDDLWPEGTINRKHTSV